MPKYLIERIVPQAGALSTRELQAISEQSNNVLRELGTDIQWVHSYIVDDKIYDTYIAASEDLLREHARLGGFPIDQVMEVRTIIDPTTAEA